MNAANFNAHYLDRLAGLGYLMPGAEEVCRLLATHCDLIVVTNGLSLTHHRRIAASSLSSFIQRVVVGQDFGVAKPEKRIFDIALEAHPGIDRSKVLMVGDGLRSDIAGGNTAGVHTCWYNPHQAMNQQGIEPTYCIAHLSDLVEIVRGTDQYSDRQG